MKKYIGVICSGLMAVLTFIFLSINWMNTKVTAGSLTTTEDGSNAWNLLKESSDVNGYTLWKVFTIIAIVLAVLLIISAVIMVLINTKVLKAKFSMNLINNILLTVFLVCVVVAIIGLVIMCNKLTGTIVGIETSTYPAVGAWLTLGFAVVTCLVSWVFSKRAK